MSDYIHLAVDKHGNRYTEHTFATQKDAWYGATILTLGVVKDLRDSGLWPLRRVEAANGEAS